MSDETGILHKVDTRIKVELVKYKGDIGNPFVYFSSDYLWEVDDNGNLIIVKEFGKDWQIATFACGEWLYVKRLGTNVPT